MWHNDRFLTAMDRVYGTLGRCYSAELTAAGKTPDDVAFLGFSTACEASYFPSSFNTADSRLLVRDVTLAINCAHPQLIPVDQEWQDRVIQTLGGNAAYHPTRGVIENGGEPTSCLMLGNNTMLYAYAPDGELVQYVHRRDNHPKNPHKLCYSPPGGMVTELPSWTASKELREELILFADRGDKYVVPYFILPPRYGVLDESVVQDEMASLVLNLPRAKAFAAIRYGKAFDTSKAVCIEKVQLEELPGIQKLEGTVRLVDERGAKVDTARGLVVHTPVGNKIGILVAACIPDSFMRAAREIYAVDGEPIPAIAAQGGREVVRLTAKELDEACARGPGDPSRALDLLKAAHLRMRLAGVSFQRAP